MPTSPISIPPGAAPTSWRNASALVYDTLYGFEGVNGADLIHYVHNKNGHCGTVVWESKRTKGWSDSWLQKLRERRAAHV
jgi:hypothetical protein